MALPNRRKSDALSIGALVLTIVLSVGGTWMANIITTNVNDSHIKLLMADNVQSKVVHQSVFKLEGDMRALHDIVRAHSQEMPRIAANSAMIDRLIINTEVMSKAVQQNTSVSNANSQGVAVTNEIITRLTKSLDNLDSTLSIINTSVTQNSVEIKHIKETLAIKS